MYETSKEIENLEKDKKKRTIIIVMMLLLIIIGLITFVFLKREKIFGKEEPKIEKKEEKPKIIENQKGTLDSDKDLDVKTIKINNKEFKLEYKYIEDEGPGTIYLKINNTTIYEEVALDGIMDIRYEVFVSPKDNKEYLFVGYSRMPDEVGVIINDELKILKEISSLANLIDNETCSVSYEWPEDDNEQIPPIITVKDGEVYYYKYKENSTDDDYNIKMDEVKITIENNKIIETMTGKTEKGSLVNCE